MRSIGTSTLNARLLPPLGHPSGTLVVCSPGGGIDRRYFAMDVPGHEGVNLATRLRKAGHVVALAELPGTRGAPGRRAGGLEAAAESLRRVVTRIERSTPHRRIVLLGHSLGGAVSYPSTMPHRWRCDGPYPSKVIAVAIAEAHGSSDGPHV